jgi:drug/metabolite transporter (DMT)-like permease
VTDSWRLGLGLSLGAVLMWGFLPVAMKGIVDRLDPVSITWVRFTFAGLVFGAVTFPRKGFAPFRQGPGVYLLLAVAATALAGNYVVYVMGLDRLSPSATQVVIQLAPMFFLLGSLALFKESFSPRQWLGVAVFGSGLVLFFHRRLGEVIAGLGQAPWGILFVAVAAAAWALYALAQKRLLKDMPAGYIMAAIFTAGAAAFLPFADLKAVLTLDGAHLGILGFCAVDTVLAYGCFSEALRHWEASRVSAVLTVVPLVTLGTVQVAAVLFPAFVAREELTF